MKNVLKKANTLLNLDNYHLVVDSLSERYVIGWARVNDDHSAEVDIEISSSSKKSYITANGYRPDVLRLKQHGTGRCGFKVDISDWQDKNVSVQVMGLAGINKKPKSQNL